MRKPYRTTAITVAAFCAGIVISGCTFTPKFTSTIQSDKEYKIQYADSAATQPAETLNKENITNPILK
jgi:hypothetical protein